MSRILVTVVITALVVAAFAPGAIGGVAAQNVTLTVTVVDSDGDALEDIAVTATWEDGDGDSGQINRTTAPNGQALFGVPEGSDVEITIDDDEYLRNFPYEIDNVEDESVEVPVSLSSNATVTVEDSNGPVEDAEVLLYRGGRLVTSNQTGADGMATTKSVERTRYSLRVRKPGYITNNTGLTIDDSANERTIQIRRDSVEVRFRVVDETFEPPQPIENATVDISGAGSLRTLSSGLATTSVSVNRDFRVTVNKDGYDGVTQTIRVGEEDTSRNISVQRTDAINVTTANQRVVLNESTLITVTDEYGERVDGATVSVGGSEVGQTDENGELRVPIENPGNNNIEVVDGDLTASTTVEGVDPDRDTPTATATATATETATDTEPATETPGEDGPGFGIVLSLLALVSALLLARRR